MNNYTKGQNVEEEFEFENIIKLFDDDNKRLTEKKILWMHVKGGTKVKNVLDYAKERLDSGEYRNIIWSGSDGGVVKTISCVEILKRQYHLHQITRLNQRTIQEYWEPITEDLERIIVQRLVPAIHIFISLDEINSNTLGYQNSATKIRFDGKSAYKQMQKNNSKQQPGTSKNDRKKDKLQQNHYSKKRKCDVDKQHKFKELEGIPSSSSDH